jgi:hypothetical protein
MAGIVDGWKHQPNHVILDAFRYRFKKKTLKEYEYNPYKFLNNTVTGKGKTIPVQELCIRYGGQECEFNQLAECIRQVKYGEYIRHPLVGRILHVDYDVDDSDLIQETPLFYI